MISWRSLSPFNPCRMKVEVCGVVGRDRRNLLECRKGEDAVPEDSLCHLSLSITTFLHIWGFQSLSSGLRAIRASQPCPWGLLWSKVKTQQHSSFPPWPRAEYFAFSALPFFLEPGAEKSGILFGSSSRASSDHLVSAANKPLNVSSLHS